VRKKIATLKPEKVSALTGDQEDAYLHGYTLQFVGLARNGVEPRDFMAQHGNRCLIPTGLDEVGSATTPPGLGISFGECPHFTKKDKFGVPVGEAQKPDVKMLFQFMIDGRVRHVQSGKCLRRALCGPSPGPTGGEDRPYIYDLGLCDENAVVKVQIWGARANRADQTMPIGNPLNGVEGPCRACGPFLMQQYCRGPCDEAEVINGWTKLPSAYLPNGGKPNANAAVHYLRFGPSPDGGLCKSAVKDDENIQPWWYFHKYDLPK
jgi:hypothetical protein